MRGGADLASGRRVERRDGFFLRRLPSHVINRLLARLTGARISDFGCAFNAYRWDAIAPVLDRIGRQKFTKALVCTTGARVVEVDLAHSARADRSRYGLFKLATLTLHVLTGFWAQLVQWVGAVLGILGILTATGVAIWGVVYWIRHGNFPGPLLLGGLVLFVLGLQGLLMAVLGEYLQRIQRGVEHRPDVLRRSRTGVVREAHSGHRRRRLHLVQHDPAPAPKHGARGGHDGRASPTPATWPTWPT